MHNFSSLCSGLCVLLLLLLALKCWYICNMWVEFGRRVITYISIGKSGFGVTSPHNVYDAHSVDEDSHGWLSGTQPVKTFENYPIKKQEKSQVLTC